MARTMNYLFGAMRNRFSCLLLSSASNRSRTLPISGSHVRTIYFKSALFTPFTMNKVTDNLFSNQPQTTGSVLAVKKPLIACGSLVPVRNYPTASRGSHPHPTRSRRQGSGLDTRNSGWEKELIITLHPDQRTQLLSALQEYENSVAASSTSPVPKLTPKEIRQLAIFAGLPFVGFGTLDNLIMISAGGYIDATFGAMLGISTMAAAALGNMVSDVAGLGTAGYVESVARRIGINPPKMSPRQYDLTSTKLTSNLGRVIGVLIGCTIGMSPLFFIKGKEEDSEETEEATS